MASVPRVQGKGKLAKLQITGIRECLVWPAVTRSHRFLGALASKALRWRGVGGGGASINRPSQLLLGALTPTLSLCFPPFPPTELGIEALRKEPERTIEVG